MTKEQLKKARALLDNIEHDKERVKKLERMRDEKDYKVIANFLLTASLNDISIISEIKDYLDKAIENEIKCSMRLIEKHEKYFKEI